MAFTISWAELPVDPDRIQEIGVRLPYESDQGGQVQLADRWLQIDGMFALSELRGLIASLRPALHSPDLVLRASRVRDGQTEEGELHFTCDGKVSELWGAGLELRELIEAEIFKRPLTDEETENLRQWSQAQQALDGMGHVPLRSGAAFGKGRATPGMPRVR